MSLADNDGFAIPFTEDDAWTECGLDDPDYGDPAEWPAWVDHGQWVSDADNLWVSRWVSPEPPPIAGGAPEAFEPTDADWDDYARWSGTITDDDLAAGGLPVG